jgi:hypothetical protein
LQRLKAAIENDKLFVVLAGCRHFVFFPGSSTSLFMKRVKISCSIIAFAMILAGCGSNIAGSQADRLPETQAVTAKACHNTPGNCDDDPAGHNTTDED